MKIESGKQVYVPIHDETPVEALQQERHRSFSKLNANGNCSRSRIIGVVALTMGVALWALGLIAIANENRAIQGLGGASMVSAFGSIIVYVKAMNKPN